MKRNELLDELEKHLNKVFNPIGLAIAKSSADVLRDQLWRVYEEAYNHGDIAEMPEDIKVSVDEATGELQATIEWPVQERIELMFSYSPETE